MSAPRRRTACPGCGRITGGAGTGSHRRACSAWWAFRIARIERHLTAWANDPASVEGRYLHPTAQRVGLIVPMIRELVELRTRQGVKR